MSWTPHIHSNLKVPLGVRGSGRANSGAKQDHQCRAVSAQGCQAQADTPHEDHQQREACPHGFISPRGAEMQEKSQLNRRQLGQQPWAAPPSTKQVTANSKGVISTTRGRTPQMSRMPGYNGCRHTEEPGQVSLTDCPGPWLALFWPLSLLTHHSTDLSTDNLRPKETILTSNRNGGDPIIHLLWWEGNSTPTLTYQTQETQKIYPASINSSFRPKKS